MEGFIDQILKTWEEMIGLLYFEDRLPESLILSGSIQKIKLRVWQLTVTAINAIR